MNQSPEQARTGTDQEAGEGLRALVTTGEQGIVRVTLAGELACDTLTQFADAMAEATSTSVTTVVLDLAHLTFLDSAGARALVMAEREARERCCRLQVLHLCGEPRRLAQLVGLERHLDGSGD